MNSADFVVIREHHSNIYSCKYHLGDILMDATIIDNAIYEVIKVRKNL